MKRIHMLPCLIGIAVAVVVLLAFGFSGFGVGTAAILLVCPLMMFGMMFFMMRGTHTGHVHDHHHTDNRDPRTAAH
jgi:hypothetical protein